MNRLAQKERDKNVIIINPEPLIRLEQGLKDIVKELKKLNEILLNEFINNNKIHNLNERKGKHYEIK